MSTAPVVRAVTVNAPAPRAFAIFTGRIGDWWPLTSLLAGGVASRGRGVPGRAVGRDRRRRSHRGLGLGDGVGPTAPAGLHLGTGRRPRDVDRRRLRGLRRSDPRRAHPFGVGGVRRRGSRPARELRQRPGVGLDPRTVRARDRDRPGPQRAECSAGRDPGLRRLPLRAGYESVAIALEKDSFEPPPPGEWNARQVAGHVITNAELMSKVLDDVRRGSPPRLHGPDDHAPNAIGRCDDKSFKEAAADVRQAGAELVARCSALTDEELATPGQHVHRASREGGRRRRDDRR